MPDEKTVASMGNLRAIKDYFGSPERPVTTAELKELSKESREELGAGAKVELAKQS